MPDAVAVKTVVRPLRDLSLVPEDHSMVSLDDLLSGGDPLVSRVLHHPGGIKRGTLCGDIKRGTLCGGIGVAAEHMERVPTAVQ